MRIALALTVLFGLATSIRFQHLNKHAADRKKMFFRNLPARGHNVSSDFTGGPCAFITAVKYANPSCTGAQTPITIIPGECLVQFSTGARVATSIIYRTASNGASTLRVVYTGGMGVCGSPDSYVYQDVIQPGVCLEGWKYTWDATLPNCWVKWQEYDSANTCETAKLSSTTYKQPRQCYFSPKFTLTWGLQCVSGTAATTTLYQQQAGSCTGTPYGTYTNASCISSFAQGVQFRATYNCAGLK